MLNEIYTPVKAAIVAADTNNEIKGIELFCMQYESTVATTPRVFIEFPDPLDFGQLSKDTKRTQLKVRCHVVTQVLAENDGTVPDQLFIDHEAIAEMIKTTLNRLQIAGVTTTFQFTGWQHWHKWKGWMVTFVDFTARMAVV